MKKYKISYIAEKNNKKEIQMKEINASSPEEALQALKQRAFKASVSISKENIHTEYFCCDCGKIASFSKDHGKTWFCSDHFKK